jgi:molecular chaperone DnaJ
MTSRPCGTCQGFGTVIPNPCRECAGDGRVRAKRNIDVKIPAGVETGNRIQLSGQGEVGAGGGPAGDLYVEIIVAEHDFLVRDGEDLHLQLNVSMTGAALGTEMKVETLDGEIEVEVKPGTQSGEMIPVKGKGMTRLRSGTRGDLYVHINVEIPTKLSKAEAELLKSFAQLRGEKLNGSQVRRNSDSSLFAKFKEAFRG